MLPREASLEEENERDQEWINCYISSFSLVRFLGLTPASAASSELSLSIFMGQLSIILLSDGRQSVMYYLLFTCCMMLFRYFSVFQSSFKCYPYPYANLPSPEARQKIRRKAEKQHTGRRHACAARERELLEADAHHELFEPTSSTTRVDASFFA